MSIVKLNNKAVSNATAFGSISSLGSMVFIKKLTASSSATLSFVDGTDGVVLDDTYKEYYFTFKDIHPSSSNSYFQFNISTDGGSNYNVAKTTTWFQSYHAENDSFSGLGYNTSRDLAQGTGYQDISTTMTTDNDLSLSGQMQLFNPSSTTFVKHFIIRANHMTDNPASNDSYCAGYGNTTSAVDAISFRMDTGNIDAGDICLYGIA
jgi:hypothetical protein